MGLKIKGVEVKTYEKIKSYYVFVINVVWSNGDFRTIFRRYSHFYDLQTTLLDKFPAEAGSKGSKRIIPYIPGKELFTNKEKAAKKRVSSLNEYCKELMHLPEYVSKCLEVVSFFRSTNKDLNQLKCKDEGLNEVPVGDDITGPVQLEVYSALADFKSQSKEEVSLKAGESVSVWEKDESGWWLVEAKAGRGYAPSTLLEKHGEYHADVIRFEPGKEENYVCTEAHCPQYKDEINIKVGAQVKVLEKWMNGWWVVSHGKNTGKVPGQKLAPARVEIVQRTGLFRREVEDVDEDEDYTDYEIIYTLGSGEPVIKTIPSTNVATEPSRAVPPSDNNIPMWKRRQSRKHTEAPPRLKEEKKKKPSPPASTHVPKPTGDVYSVAWAKPPLTSSKPTLPSKPRKEVEGDTTKSPVNHKVKVLPNIPTPSPKKSDPARPGINERRAVPQPEMVQSGSTDESDQEDYMNIPTSNSAGTNTAAQTRYRALYAYEARSDKELSIFEGDVVELLDNNSDESGWWKVELRHQVGWVPITYLEPLAPVRPPPAPPVPKKKKVPTATLR